MVPSTQPPTQKIAVVGSEAEGKALRATLANFAAPMKPFSRYDFLTAVEKAKADIEAQDHGYENAAQLFAKRDREYTDPMKTHRITLRMPSTLEVTRCNHKLDPREFPRQRNCEHCWFAYFSAHPPEVAAAKTMLETTEIPIPVVNRQLIEKFTKKGAKFLMSFITQIQLYEAQSKDIAKAEIAEIMHKPVNNG